MKELSAPEKSPSGLLSPESRERGEHRPVRLLRAELASATVSFQLRARVKSLVPGGKSTASTSNVHPTDAAGIVATSDAVEELMKEELHAAVIRSHGRRSPWSVRPELPGSCASEH